MARSKSPAAGKKPAGTPPPPATRSKAPAVLAAPPVTSPKVTLKALVILVYALVVIAANYEQGLKYKMCIANHVSACAVGVAVLLDEKSAYYKNATFVCVLVALAGQWYHYMVPHFADVHGFMRQVAAAWPDISTAWNVAHDIVRDIDEKTPRSLIHASILKHENISDFIVEQAQKRAV